MNNEEKILALLTTMQGDMSEMKTGIKQLDNRIQSLEKTVEDGFRATRSELVDAVECVGRKVEHLGQSLKDVESVTAQNAYDVQLIKRQA